MPTAQASSPNRLSLGSRPHIDRVIINASPSPPRWLYIFPEKDAPPSMSLIEHLGENTIQMPHPSGQVPLGCLNHDDLVKSLKTVTPAPYQVRGKLQQESRTL